ncbi:hypothetical protein GGS20DRAFT_261999 [Poronia punctata]|nr:hypothetical protein GGS20DRAFT_261999 [Poronia punctata]
MTKYPKSQICRQPERTRSPAMVVDENLRANLRVHILFGTVDGADPSWLLTSNPLPLFNLAFVANRDCLSLSTVKLPKSFRNRRRLLTNSYLKVLIGHHTRYGSYLISRTYVQADLPQSPFGSHQRRGFHVISKGLMRLLWMLLLPFAAWFTSGLYLPI